MLRKSLATLSAVALAFFFLFSVSEAATLTTGKMFDTFLNKYKTENYDFKPGSFSLQDAQTFTLDKPITIKKGTDQVQVTKIQAAIAHFKTVRDGIFFKDWIDYAYYSPETDTVLTEGDVMNIQAIKQYEAAHHTSVKLELGPIVGLLLLLFIVPMIFGLIWSRTRYSSLEFKLKNNLLDPKG